MSDKSFGVNTVFKTTGKHMYEYMQVCIRFLICLIRFLIGYLIQGFGTKGNANNKYISE